RCPHPAALALSTLPLHDALPILPGEPEPAVRALVVVGVVVVAAAPARVVADRLELRVGPGDLVTRGLRRRRDRSDPADPLGCHRSEEHTSELQSRFDLVCRLLLE